MRLSAPPDANTTAGELQWLEQFIAQQNDTTRAQIAYWNAGSPGYRWMRIASQTVSARNPAAPLGTRALALISVAIYDATIAAWDSKYAFNRKPPSALDAKIVPLVNAEGSPSYPSVHAVVAGAASAVLAYLFPDSADLYASLANEASRSRLFAGVAYPSDVTAGLTLGKQIGAKVIAYAQADGSSMAFTGSYPSSPGVWGNANPVTPLAGTWQPWVLTSGSQFRLSAPPAFGSADANTQYATVKNRPLDNNPQQRAWFWQPSFIFPWLDTVDREIFENNLAANPPRAARAYALATIAQHDATIACWDTKYTYLELRPSMADPMVTTLFANPGHPGYPSGHACALGSSAGVLSYLFPADSVAFSDQAVDAGMSTFDAGIHTQFDVQQGLTLGQTVANAIVAVAQKDGSQ